MPLKGIRVVELAGLAPAPFCGMLLSDFGATVTLISKSPDNTLDVLTAGKRALSLNLKHAKGRTILRKLCLSSDVLIEPYRPGVMENLGLGPADLMGDNPRMIYARLTGFGQTGPIAARAGHDINYVAMSGVLSMLGRREQRPTPPINLLADMAGGGLMCAFGILAALLERDRSGRGQVVDASMTEGCAYVASWLTRSQNKLPIWGQPRGANVLDSGRFFYDTYETLDGRFMSVGAIEPQFFRAFVDTLGLPDLEQYGGAEAEATSREKVAAVFSTKTQADWERIFNEVDACVFPVLDWQTAAQNAQHAQRESFVDKHNSGGDVVPSPAPRLSRTPAVSSVKRDLRESELDVLREMGIPNAEIIQLQEQGAINLTLDSKIDLQRQGETIKLELDSKL